MKKSDKFYRSTKVSMKFANRAKADGLAEFHDEYRDVVGKFVDILWEMEKIPRLLPKEVTSSIDTWLSARARQAAAKQASGIVRGTRKKHRQRLYIHADLLKQGCFKKARKLMKIIEAKPISKPDIETVNPELDSRFVKFDMDNDTGFFWMTISSIGDGRKIVIPFKSTKHLEKMNDIGEMRPGVRLGKSRATVSFEGEAEEASGKTVGIDIGVSTALTVSDGQVDAVDLHGHTLSRIQQKISTKRRGSKAFKKAADHRRNHIGMLVNSISIAGIGLVRIENIKNLRRGKKSSRFMSAWTYTELLGRLSTRCEERGVRVERVDPTYTSQRCSECGWTRKRNRRGKEFGCSACSFACDADLNASINISLGLPALSREQRSGRSNLKGFYWAPGFGSP